MTNTQTKRRGRGVGGGGRQPGSGKKPNAAKLVKEVIQAQAEMVAKTLRMDAAEEADYAFSLYSHFMRDPQRDDELRVACADRILDRVLGKPFVQAKIVTHDMTPRAFSYAQVAAVLMSAAVEQGVIEQDVAIGAIGQLSSASVATAPPGSAVDHQPPGA